MTLSGIQIYVICGIVYSMIVGLLLKSKGFSLMDMLDITPGDKEKDQKLSHEFLLVIFLIINIIAWPIFMIVMVSKNK